MPLPKGNSEYLSHKPKIRQQEHDKTMMALYCNSHRAEALFMNALTEILLLNFFFFPKEKLKLSSAMGEKTLRRASLQTQ